MAKGSSCFYCKNSCEINSKSPGHSYICSKGIDNSKMNDGMDDVLRCPKSSPRVGFSIGGYYTHMTVEKESIDSGCFRWTIQGDGSFPSEDEDEWLSFHLCDFNQLVKFVEFWVSYLAKRELELKRLLGEEKIEN